MGPVLYGSVQEWICQERKGWRKYENFKLLHAENNERGATAARYVFIGDNGSSEKDLEAAERIAEAFPDELCAVFLHAVSATESPAPLPDDHAIGSSSVPVRYFRTYASAAAKAAELGLISSTAARRVLDSIESSMANDSADIARGSDNRQLLMRELEVARTSVGGPLRGAARALGWPLRRLLGP